ncbi:MAG: hypothetical protein ACQEP2_04885 [Actinomycetota bacterium]
MKKFVKKNLNILVAGFGCCKQEIYASRAPLYDVGKMGINFVCLPEMADLLIVQGFINEDYAGRVISFYESMAKPKWVAMLGTCAIDGCIFGQNRATGIMRKEIPIDIYVPGCPPRPEAFIYSILRLLDKYEY